MVKHHIKGKKGVGVGDVCVRGFIKVDSLLEQQKKEILCTSQCYSICTVF